MKNRMIHDSGLPQNKVTLCAVGEIYQDVIAALETRGISVLPVPRNSMLPSGLSCHADLQICHTGEEIVYIAPDSGLDEMLEKNGFKTFLSGSLNPLYPEDCILNTVILPESYLANSRCIDNNLSMHLQRAGKSAIEVKQGYAKCSTCVVDERSIITADQTIAETAENLGIDVLRIRPGHIRLRGYNYGFIGGCCGKLGKNLIAFTGLLERHPDGALIKSFLRKKNVSYIELTNEILYDIGSIVPLLEREE